MIEIRDSLSSLNFRDRQTLLADNIDVDNLPVVFTEIFAAGPVNIAALGPKPVADLREAGIEIRELSPRSLAILQQAGAVEEDSAVTGGGRDLHYQSGSDRSRNEDSGDEYGGGLQRF